MIIGEMIEEESDIEEEMMLKRRFKKRIFFDFILGEKYCLLNIYLFCIWKLVYV